LAAARRPALPPSFGLLPADHRLFSRALGPPPDFFRSVAIKMVLYEWDAIPPVVEALLESIEEGKQVDVPHGVEGRASDEESNIPNGKARRVPACT